MLTAASEGKLTPHGADSARNRGTALAQNSASFCYYFDTSASKLRVIQLCCSYGFASPDPVRFCRNTGITDCRLFEVW